VSSAAAPKFPATPIELVRDLNSAIDIMDIDTMDHDVAKSAERANTVKVSAGHITLGPR
jgi:hypothetical protein